MRTMTAMERGQALIIIALVMVGLVAIVGLAIDGGTKFSDQRRAQNAADTAALAAALAKVETLAYGEEHPGTVSTTPEICPPPSGDMLDASDVCAALYTAGLDLAGINGYDNFTNNTVEIYSPPQSGIYTGQTDYVQVIITSTINTTFARVVGFTQLTNRVQAVALAKPGFDLADGAMIISYDPDPQCSVTGTGGYSVSVSGDATVNLKGGGIFLNSDEVCGFTIPNCADLNITTVEGSGVEPGISSVGADNIDQGSCPTQANEYPNQEPVIIPDDIYWPPVPAECSMSGSPTPTFLGTILVDNKEVEEWLIYPGFYTEFPQATLLPNAEEVAVGKRSRIYMKSGVYCIDPPMDKDLSWSPVAASMLNGSTNPDLNKFQKPGATFKNYNPDGVTLYIRKGGGFSLNMNGDSPTYLDATNDPDSEYQGYLVVLEGNESSIESCEINGGAKLDINGLIFAPYCDITINGGAGESASINAQIIGWDIKINGTNEINFNYDPSNQVKIKTKVGLMK